MAVLQLVHKLHACRDLLSRVLELAVLHPGLAVYGLQVVHQEDHPVVLAHGQGIVIFIKSLERLPCREEGRLIRGNSHTHLVKGSLIPVEQPSCQRHGNCHQLAVRLAQLQALRRELGQVKHILVILQISKILSVTAVGLDPVPVDLHHIRRVAAHDVKGLFLLPPGPCTVLRGHGDVGVLGHKCLDGLLCGLVPGVAAPPGKLKLYLAAVPGAARTASS